MIAFLLGSVIIDVGWSRAPTFMTSILPQILSGVLTNSKMIKLSSSLLNDSINEMTVEPTFYTSVFCSTRLTISIVTTLESLGGAT